MSGFPIAIDAAPVRRNVAGDAAALGGQNEINSR
jgi:hypothetical protein